MSQPSSLSRKLAIIIFLCVVVAGVAGLIRANFGPPYVPRLGDPIGLRGDRVAILRLPTTPIQEIAIYEDDHANRYAYPIKPNIYSQVRLTSSEQHEFEQLRIDWCKQIPSMPERSSDKSLYDLAFRCGASGGTQAKVPVDRLPAFFVHLLQQLPDYGKSP
jgi:hypothetical protein